MTEKFLRHKKGKDGMTEQTPSPRDDRKRFGAVAFFDSRMETADDCEEAELSLDALREAFAASQDRSLSTKLPPTFGENRLPGESRPREFEESRLSDDSVEETSDEADEPVDGEDKESALNLNPAVILEAMLFVGNRENRSLTPQQAAERMRNVTAEDIINAVDELNRTYNRLGCPYHIVSERSGYRMVLCPEFESIRKNFYGRVREATLSQRAIDTLAIVAYRQPISAEEVQKLWKGASISVLSQLVRRGLLSSERQSGGKKKGVMYRTTERFLELFNLTSLDDLPQIVDAEDCNPLVP